MIIRIVKMKFDPERVQDFQMLYKKTRPGILEFSGCLDVKLLQSEDDPTILSTYSLWDSTASLNKYRFSEFFKLTWTTIKPWMTQKADAISYLEINP